MSRRLIRLMIRLLPIYCSLAWQLSEAYSIYPEGKEMINGKVLRATGVHVSFISYYFT